VLSLFGRLGARLWQGVFSNRRRAGNGIYDASVAIATIVTIQPLSKPQKERKEEQIMTTMIGLHRRKAVAETTARPLRTEPANSEQAGSINREGLSSGNIHASRTFERTNYLIFLARKTR
jgi:hypothetical protein